jgi:hypothetical protein
MRRGGLTKHFQTDQCGRTQKWEYIVMPLEAAGKVKKKDAGLSPDHLNELGAEGWDAVGLTLKRGDLVAWPVVLLKRPIN